MFAAIITESFFLVLGIKTAPEFLRVVGDTEAPLTIDDAFLEKIKMMEPVYGFDEAHKTDMILSLSKAKNQKCIIKNEFLYDYRGATEQLYMRLVSLLNLGFSLEYAEIMSTNL